MATRLMGGASVPGRVQIRLPLDTDVDAIVAIYRPIVEATPISFETQAPDHGEMARRIGDTMGPYPWLLCDVAGEIAGYAYATRHRAREAYRWSVETSVYVDGRYRRRGVARGLYQSLLALLTAQGYVTACAGIALPNPASVVFHESLGFEQVGVYRRIGYKRGRWHDVGWWQRNLKDAADPPTEPVDVAALAGGPGWEALIGWGSSSMRVEGA